jgi:hypothetical protein
MIDRKHKLPLKRQAQLLDISRGTVYYRPEPVSPADLSLMRRIDELHLEWSTRLPAAACCAICCGCRASRWAAGTWAR